MSDSYQATYDAVRSKVSQCDTDSAVRAAISEAFANVSGVVSGMCGSIEQEATRPSVLMRPSISIDGNQYCALYGENLQDGVAGFGDTPEAAMRSFDLAWIGRNGVLHMGEVLPATVCEAFDAVGADCRDIADFIAHSRQDIPKLLAHIQATDALHREQAAEIERLRGENDRLQGVLGYWAPLAERALKEVPYASAFHSALSTLIRRSKELHATLHPPVLDAPDGPGWWKGVDPDGDVWVDEVHERVDEEYESEIGVRPTGRLSECKTFQRITLPTPAPQQPSEKPATTAN